MVKSKSYQTMNLTEKRVTVNDENKTEKTSAICPG